MHILCSKFNDTLNVINDLVPATTKPLMLVHSRGRDNIGQPNRLILSGMVHGQGAFVALAET